MLPEEEVLKKVKHWISFADEDLSYARLGLSLKKKAPCRLIAFHAQQAVEKYLKSYLIFRLIEFPYTHNISTLIKCITENEKLVNLLKDAENLTFYAVSSRYPDEDIEISFDEAVNAVFIATNVMEVIKRALNDLGLSSL